MLRFPLILGVCLLTCATATAQNAESAAKTAEYYLRTGHPDSASFYMQLYTQAKKADDPTGPGPGKEKEKPKKADPLEKLIAEAVKNNPDIRVAETRLRAVEAETSRTRLKVISELTILHADIEAAQYGAKEGEARYERAKILFMNKGITAEDLAAAQLTYVKLKAELAVLQARLPYLLGKQTAGVGPLVLDPLALMKATVKLPITDEEFARRVSLDVLGRLPTPEEMKKFLAMPEKDRREKWIDHMESTHPFRLWIDAERGRVDRILVDKYMELVHKVPESPLTEKLRKALDSTVRMTVDRVGPKDVFEYMRDKGMLGGINVVVRAKLKKDPVTIKLDEPVPVGAVLQYLEDELGVIFILREYGIVVVAADERLPPDAVRVIDFWKHGAAPKTGATPQAK